MERITGELYPEVAELLEHEILETVAGAEKRMDFQQQALELLNHPDAHFMRNDRSLEERFVTYRGPQEISVTIPSQLKLEATLAREGARRSRAGSMREIEVLDRLRQVAFVALVRLLENEA